MRHPFLYLWIIAGLVTLIADSDCRAQAKEKPNVLFISIDDLNDWVGCLGGHPQAKTPHMDDLATRGMLFRNAHCTVAYCNPSRTSVLTGLRPSTTGIYDNPQRWTRAPRLQNAVTLPQHFRANAYRALRGGKIFHGTQPPSWDEHFPGKYKFKQAQAVATGQDFNGLAEQIGKKGQYDWGPIDVADEATMDGQTTAWAVAQLSKKQQQPFFLAVGIIKPHEPWYVPRRYFEMHPLEKIILPPVKQDDLADVPQAAIQWAHNNNHYPVAIKNQALPAIVQAYLATVSFVDAQVGKIVDALQTGPNSENTIIVLWSDHGYHIGTKEHIDKKTLWEEATRVPLIIVAPGVTRAKQVCDQPVSLLDLYPTLIDLCDLPSRKKLEGESLLPLLKNPAAPRKSPAITTVAYKSHSIRDQHWRYTRYADGGEELYDHRNDPHEWNNLANDPGKASIKSQLAKWLPSYDEPEAPRNKPVPPKK